jgi:5-methylcytosine-specific restriction endonuclease McrA
MKRSHIYHSLYDSVQWRKLRRDQLQSNPLCKLCESQGITSAAGVADHVTPHKGNQELFFNAKNLQSLCKPCHDKHKRLKELRGIMPGCDLNGLPLDSASHWFK